MWLAVAGDGTETLALLGIAGTTASGVVIAFANSVMGKSQWRREHKTDDATGAAAETLRADVNKLQGDAAAADQYTKEWRAEHSFSDRELERRFTAVDVAIAAIRRLTGRSPRSD